jgi:hypothetical protein
VRCRRPVNRSLSLHRGPVGEPGGGSFAGIFQRNEKDMRVPFLDPEDTKILSLGAIYNFDKGTEFSSADTRLWGTKALSIRPRCVGTVRA